MTGAAREEGGLEDGEDRSRREVRERRDELNRPNVHAMSGSVTIDATVDTMRSRTTTRRHPSTRPASRRRASTPDAISAPSPATLS